MNLNSDMSAAIIRSRLLSGVTLLLGTVTLFSCRQTVYFDIETQENRLVVNGFIQPDADAELTVSLSQDPLAIGFEDVMVENAVITIDRNGDYAGTFTHAGEGVYTLDASTLLAEPGDTFTITAEAEGRTTVTSTATIPTIVPILSCYISDTILEPISYSTYDSLGNIIYIDTVVPYFEIKLTFQDSEQDDNYIFNVEYEDAFSSSTNACFSTDEPAFALEAYNAIGSDETDERITYCNEVIFSDLTFNGDVHTITVRVFALETTFITDPEYHISLRHISDAYYQYFTTARAQEINGDNPFSTPVVVFSNIENGFGIFAGFTESVAIIPL